MTMTLKLKTRGSAKPPQIAGEQFLEFEPKTKTLLEAEALAREANCTPFEMCAILLQEQLSLNAKQPEGV